MRFSISLIGDFSVFVDGVELSAAPNRTVATLLLGLVSNGDRWISRQDVAKRLYPDSDVAHGPVAVRQALSRLKHWLGPTIIEERQGCIRLAPGMWETDWDSPGQSNTLSLIAPGLNHPWVEEIRRERQPHQPEQTDALHQDFARAVELTAQVDADAARSVLVGGYQLINCIEPHVASRLLGLTEPKVSRDPCAFEHSELRGILYYSMGAIRMALQTQLRSYRMATQQKSPTRMARAAAWAMFAEVESGAMSSAGVWMDRVASFGRVSSMKMMLSNAHATFLWNSQRVNEALNVMLDASSVVASADRVQLVHYWTNLSLLAAGAGDFDLSRKAEGLALERMIPTLDYPFCATISLSRATRKLISGEYEEANTEFRTARTRTMERGYRIGYWYATEGYAESLACSGQGREAVRMWNEIEATRHAEGLKLTPRLQARKARILAVA